jgi:hypothetical protein
MEEYVDDISYWKQASLMPTLIVIFAVMIIFIVGSNKLNESNDSDDSDDLAKPTSQLSSDNYIYHIKVADDADITYDGKITHFTSPVVRFQCQNKKVITTDDIKILDPTCAVIEDDTLYVNGQQFYVSIEFCHVSDLGDGNNCIDTKNKSKYGSTHSHSHSENNKAKEIRRICVYDVSKNYRDKFKSCDKYAILNNSLYKVTRTNFVHDETVRTTSKYDMMYKSDLGVYHKSIDSCRISDLINTKNRLKQKQNENELKSLFNLTSTPIIHTTVTNDTSNVVTNDTSNVITNDTSNVVTNDTSNVVTNDTSNVVTSNNIVNASDHIDTINGIFTGRVFPIPSAPPFTDMINDNDNNHHQTPQTLPPSYEESMLDVQL